jgi:hypothetical protein
LAQLFDIQFFSAEIKLPLMRAYIIEYTDAMNGFLHPCSSDLTHPELQGRAPAAGLMLSFKNIVLDALAPQRETCTEYACQNGTNNHWIANERRGKIRLYCVVIIVRSAIPTVATEINDIQASISSVKQTSSRSMPNYRETQRKA